MPFARVKCKLHWLVRTAGALSWRIIISYRYQYSILILHVKVFLL